MEGINKQFFHPFLESVRKAGKKYEKICMNTAKPFNLSRNEADIILFLSNNQNMNTAMDIVRYRQISKSVVSQSVESLVSKGYLETEVDEADRRYSRLYLLPKSDEAALTLQKAQSKFFSNLFSTLTPSEYSELLRIFGKVADQIENYTGDE